jgi:hypothetical protein
MARFRRVSMITDSRRWTEGDQASCQYREYDAVLVWHNQAIGALRVAYECVAGGIGHHIVGQVLRVSFTDLLDAAQ